MIKKILVVMSMIIWCLHAVGQTFSLAGKVTEIQNGSVIPFANVALYSVLDTAQIVKGGTTDLQGYFLFKDIIEGSYVLKVSYIGFSSVIQSFNSKESRDRTMVVNVSLKKKSINLDQILIKGSRVSHNIDKSVYTFSDTQIKKAKEGRDLLLNLPNLHIDKANNGLSTISGKSILILINGIQANDVDLKLIPANKIRKVEYYDVPPVRYMNNAEIVINVLTKNLEAGWNGDFYLLGGQMYSNGSSALSRTNGKHKFTLSYNYHINNKRSVKDIEEGIYQYSLNNDFFDYAYNQKRRKWGNQNTINFIYLNAKENDYAFQINAITTFNVSHLQVDKDIQLKKNENIEYRNGNLDDKVDLCSPSIDVYYSKKISEKASLTFNIVGTYFDNKQSSYSFESGTGGFEDYMKLDTQKKSLIGEVVYNQKISKLNLTAGYRGGYNFLSNKLRNSLDMNSTKEHINTQTHYFYGELSGRINSFMYRASLGGNYDVKLGDMGFNNLTFTPLLLLGYNINQENSLRLSFQSHTTMPDIQQMSDNRILVMDHFFRTGNPELENSISNYWGLIYDFSNKFLNVQANLFYENRKNSLYDRFDYNKDYIEIKTDNSYKDIRRGLELNVTLTPCDIVRLGGNIGFVQQSFQPVEDFRRYRHWAYPISLYFGLNYKKYSLTYLQRFGGQSINGLYKNGTEKVSYINIAYSHKKIQIGLQCLFPFIKDKFVNETIPGTVVFHKTMSHLKRKDRAFAISFSWNFTAGRQKEIIDKSIQNSDSDSGIFNIQ